MIAHYLRQSRKAVSGFTAGGRARAEFPPRPQIFLAVFLFAIAKFLIHLFHFGIFGKTLVRRQLKRARKTVVISCRSDRKISADAQRAESRSGRRNGVLKKFRATLRISNKALGGRSRVASQ